MPAHRKGPENEFETGFIEQQALVESQPVDNTMLFTVTDSLEETGLKLVGAGKVKTERFAGAMHQVYSQISGIEIVPPLNEDQIKKVAGKVATFGAMREAAAPKTAAKPQQTDTKQTSTDQRKK